MVSICVLLALFFQLDNDGQCLHALAVGQQLQSPSRKSSRKSPSFVWQTVWRFYRLRPPGSNSPALMTSMARAQKPWPALWHGETPRALMMCYSLICIDMLDISVGYHTQKVWLNVSQIILQKYLSN